MLLTDLDTPALLVERRRLDANLRRMQATAETHGVALRPHLKTHKSVALARLQRDLGARGVTVAKPEEAEVFAEAGFDDVRLAYCVVGEAKWARLHRLMARGVRVSFCVDTVEGARLASAFFERHGAVAEVLIEVDTGHGRCGIVWDDPDASALAEAVRDLPGLKLVGLLTHGGQGYFGPDEGETPAAALVRAEPAYRPLVKLLLQNYFVADSLEQARALREQYAVARFVTPSGEWTSARGITHAGGADRSAAGERLGRREQLESAEAQQTAMQAEIEAAEEEVRRLRGAREALALDARRADLRTAERAFDAATRDAAQAAYEHEARTTRRAELADRLADLRTQREEAEHTTDLDRALADAQAAHADAQQVRADAEAAGDAAEAAGRYRQRLQAEFPQPATSNSGEDPQ